MEKNCFFTPETSVFYSYIWLRPIYFRSVKSNKFAFTLDLFVYLSGFLKTIFLLMKHHIIACAIAMAAFMCSCSEGFTGDKACELYEKLSQTPEQFTQSDAENMLREYESCCWEIHRLNKKRQNKTATEEEETNFQELVSIHSKLEHALLNVLKDRFPHVADMAEETGSDWNRIYDAQRK